MQRGKAENPSNSYTFYEGPRASGFVYPGASLETLSMSPRQVQNMLRRAATHPHATQLCCLMDACSRAFLGGLRIKNGPGGSLILHPEDAGSQLAAAFGSALEQMGCLHKLGISPEPFDGGPLPAWWGAR